ncbi:hypothetical protein Vretimale_9675 [Volvox reticuliferus]|uniref:mRNA-decapping enzyme-like protein n=1 Tax=Volvox reticuliferus TaxID=1737510 RepID=A0A8J4FS51_9CHLO|nr:hypothetical protein Vretifemale_13431 [Volvox reticuliferus]GIM05224.1 hypothetical protein Vretimale_9675 [Volvox reticuliferus]
MASPGIVASPDILAVLKGFDPDVEEILASSGHVALYKMVAESQAWDYKDVEGSLFLLKRRGTPRFRMMVLNKRSTKNFTEDVHSELHFEIHPPYLMYTHGNSLITGVWFYEQDDLQRFGNILMRVKDVAETPEPAAPADMPEPTVPAESLPAARSPSDDDDNGFYDKPVRGAANAQNRQLQPAAFLPKPSSTPTESNLANLLRNAKRKQQQGAEQMKPAAQQPVAVPPPPIPPSFFSQPQRAAPQPPPTAGPSQPPVPAPAAPQAAPTASSVNLFAPHVLIPSASNATEQQHPTSEQKGGALAKLFANAHKPLATQPPPQQLGTPPQQHSVPPPPHLTQPLQQSAQPQPAAAFTPSQPTARQPPPMPGPAMTAAAGPRNTANASDQERVRRLLTRIAANDEIVRLLAVEMRAAGLL